MKNGRGIEKWLNVKFISSSGRTEQFTEFAKDFKAYLKKLLPNYEMVGFNAGHFYLSGFLKKDSQCFYFSTPDVRSSDGWYNNLLLRTAKNEGDYTGGQNNYTCLKDISMMLQKLKEALRIDNKEAGVCIKGPGR